MFYRLDVEAELDYVAVLHQYYFAFPQLLLLVEA